VGPVSTADRSSLCSTPESPDNDGANGHRFSIMTRGRDNVSWNWSRCVTHHSNPPKESPETFLSGICLELTHLVVGLVRRPGLEPGAC
jgi:hypothetical protein